MRINYQDAVVEGTKSACRKEQVLAQSEATLTPWNELVGAELDMIIGSRPKTKKNISQKHQEARVVW